ncbi:hypothetical protein Ae201684P_004793 [Aphanomyces euteiches]|uniref:PH domain-containing protein n=1 Tax=Aphanomyces euteiches TaxID=100861 RepID=A0A6G0XCV0_9STRA|nr:hypothetical protein Ae201684_005982 [Aphanomyces euteiches]KAH9069099.1 hypothetical protein Ae201684P_004793 [Aphanomyces euteiches]KAH9144880.1 hypothetical protein AeRB84_011201 [Aphanomyces euteiches]
MPTEIDPSEVDSTPQLQEKKMIKSIVRRERRDSVVDSVKSLLFKPKRNSVQFSVTQTYMLPPRLAALSELYYTKSELEDIQWSAKRASASIDMPQGTVLVQSFLTVLLTKPTWKQKPKAYYVVLRDQNLLVYRNQKDAYDEHVMRQMQVAKAIAIDHDVQSNESRDIPTVAYTFAVVDREESYVLFATESSKAKSAWLTALQHCLAQSFAEERFEDTLPCGKNDAFTHSQSTNNMNKE